MKLKKLDITNIASISSASIDFTAAPLADSPIFLICGETGSGKSTILDAICLALYNKTPRLANGNKTEENIYKEGSQEISIVSVSQLLKKGEKKGTVSLLFEGADGSDYVAEWECNVTQSGKLDKEKWSVTDSQGNTDSSKGKKRDDRMTEIIGLDYTQFCRTAMLAQGKFTEFLKANSQDKSDILEKITGTEIYAAIGTRIHKKAKDASDELKAAKNAVDAVTLLSPDVREAHIREMAEIDGLIKKNNTAIGLLDSLVKAFEAIEAADDTIGKSEKTLGTAKGTFAMLTADIACRKAAKSKKQEQADSLAVQVEEQKGNAEMYANVQSIESHLGNIARQRGIQETQNGILDRENGALKTAAEAMEELKGRKRQAEEELEKKNQAITDAQNAKKALDPDGVEKERKSIADGLDLVGKASTDYARIQTREENLATARTDYARIDGEITAERQTAETLMEQKEKAEKEYRDLQDVYTLQAQVLDDAAIRVREWLRETGVDECPVCHARIESLTTTEQEEDRLKPLKDHVDKKKKEKEAADTALTQARTALATKESEHLKAKENIGRAEQDLQDLKDNFSRKYSPLGITGREEDLKGILDKIAADLNDRKTGNEKAISEVGEKQKIVEDAIRERDAFQKDVLGPVSREYTDTERKITEINGKIESARNLAKAAAESETESLGKARELISIHDWEKAWTEDPDSFVSGLKEDAKVYNDNVKALDAIGEEIVNAEKIIRETSEVHDRILMAESDFEPESVCPAEYPGNAIIEWGALESTVKSAREGLRVAKESKANSKASLSEAFAADTTLPQTKGELQDKKSTLNSETIEKSTRLGVLRQIIEDDDKDSKSLKEKKEKYDEASRLNAQWKTLDDLFGGKDGFAFKKIAQSYIMQDILNHANAYLRKIAPRYELTAQPGSLVILVKDNDEGGVRSGNTLSGGEGFVISLSLALGLSSLAENSISVDTIFIDEGFGTLSQEWLNSVMAALEKLNATSGRHVGIISHIEDLQKRIPTVIEVKKTNATTSEISVRG